MPATLVRSEEALELDLSSCKGTEFSDTLAKVKEIPGRRFDGDRKLWCLPLEPQIAERILFAIQPEADPSIEEWVRSARQETERELVSPLPEDGELLVPWATARAEWQPETVNEEPVKGMKAHQRALVAAICGGNSDELRAVIADDQGLGKTIQALTAVAEHQTKRGAAKETSTGYGTGDKPKLIVCPTSAKGVWAREIERWLGDEPVQIIDGTTKAARHRQLSEAATGATWVIVNYEQLRTTKEKRKLRNGGMKQVEAMKEPLFENVEWLAVIADEAHRIKNRKAAQTRGLYRIEAPIMLALTGTPIMNSPDELWSLLHWLFKKEYTSYWRFYEQYVDYIEGYFGKVITGVRNPDALRFELNKRLYRRTKDQVLDLPEKQRIFVPVELSAKQRKLYSEAEQGLWVEIEQAIAKGDKSAERLAEAAESGKNIFAIPNAAARTVRLRQILSSPALLGGDDDSAKLDAVETNILDNAHKQHVVFCEFVETCSLLAERLKRKGLKAEVYTGETEEHHRTRLEDEFQRGQIDVLIGTIGAMRESITLTASNTEHFVERAWVPGWNHQAEDRCHRIGQSKTVTIYIYVAQDTVDDGRIMPTNRRKEQIVKAVLQQDEIKES